MENLQVLINQEAGKISFNFEEMKSFLMDRLEEYRGAVFTDDSIVAAKKYVASLRKEQTEFKCRVSEVKKEYMKPFDQFKEKADELVRLYDEPINFIDGQVKDFEQRRKADKRAEIQNVFNELQDDIKEYVTLEKIYNPKWENATYKIKDVINDISEIAVSVRNDVNTIKGMNSDAVESALELYKSNRNLSDAISYINSYERQKLEIIRREEEKRKREEEERIRREEREKIAAEMKMAEMEKRADEEKRAVAEQAAAEAIESFIPDISGGSNLYEYRMSLTEDAKSKLEMFLDSVGIEWELING